METEEKDIKQCLADSVMRLLISRSLSKITVQDIVDGANTSRRTFYNYFRDKYDLIEWIYKTDAVDYVNLIGDDVTWREAVITKLNIIKNNPDFYDKVYRQEWFLKSFRQITTTLYMNLINKKGGGKEMEFEVDFYCSSCVQKTAEWILNGFQESPDELVDKFTQCLSPKLREFLLDN